MQVGAALVVDLPALAKLAGWAPPAPVAVARLVAEPIEGFQPRGTWAAGGRIPVGGKGTGSNEGWLLEVLPT